MTRVPGGTTGLSANTMRRASGASRASRYNGSVARRPDVCVSRCRTVIAAVPEPLNSGTYVATAASSRTFPRSTSSMRDVVVAITFVSDARS
ncbi:MAG: hypothetical protein DMD36_14910 [Gemmatimonadetes bacterium]|nr:MAG: hypothetical protein DMD36_14910 [Gemmatimonadota bacterium]